MKIVMIEPLNVSNTTIERLSQPLIDDGHSFVMCDHALSIDAKLEKAIDADILIVTNGTITPQFIEKLPNLKMISVGFTGIDHLPIDTLKNRQITVSNSQGYATIPTAEMALTHMLMATRYVTQTQALCKNGKTKQNYIGNELTNKTVGIVGTGQIGLQLAKLLQGFNVDLLAYDPYPKKEGTILGIDYTTLDSLFTKSDFITLHLPLTEDTKGLIDENLFNLMQEEAVFINCARGPIVDQNALINALKNKRIRAAGVDVYVTEPPLDPNHPFFHINNINTTPHIAFASQESMVRRAQIVFDNIVAYIEGSPINVKI